MVRYFSRAWLVILMAFSCSPSLLHAQSISASISGRVLDSSGAVIPGARLSLRAVATGEVTKVPSGRDGTYGFPNLQAGTYDLTVSAKGFRDFVQRGISVNINQVVRVDVTLQLGTAVQTVEVNANASPLNFQNAQLQQAVTPSEIRELPLLVSGNIRSAAQFVVLMPGVTTGGGNQGYDARINGGMQSGDEAEIDGVTMQDSMNSQSGMTEAYTDHPMSPDTISEISVLTSNYDPQYGNTTSGVITAVTKSGTNQFHGDLYEFARNTAFNARPYDDPARPPDIENDFGGTVGGPIKIPGVAWTNRKKTYFFVGYEVFHIAGANSTPTLSVPTMQERSGDFSDWKDSSGNLIPIYDPTTTRGNPSFNPSLSPSATNLPFLRNQFPGNVIPASEIQGSTALQWFKYLPPPNLPGILNNYKVPTPVPVTVFADASLLDIRGDEYYRSKDHFAVTVHYHGSAGSSASELPVQLSTQMPYGVNYGFLDRLNWDHTFSPTLFNNTNFGYNTQNIIATCLDEPYAGDLPKISGLADYTLPPIVNFQNFSGFGCGTGAREERPEEVVNDQMTWVRGVHTLEFGGEYRWLGFNNTNIGYPPTFYFDQANTGLLGIQSGSDIASFLLGAVSSASETFPTVTAQYPRQRAWSLHAGDTWKATPSLSIDYGLRWDVFAPATEKFNHLSFFDPQGINPGAGGRPGSLAFAGTQWGPASFGRRSPETTWYSGVAPRVGIAYRLNRKTVVRTGYGIFYSDDYYPGWGGGVSQDGFSTTPSFSSGEGGLQPAFLLSRGFPQDFQHPPLINASADNGLSSILFRPFNADRLPYAQQWNLSVEHQFTNNLYASAAYVGNKGTRLLSQTAPLNALNPGLLSMGEALNDQFQPGQTSLDGVSIPYAGWVQQMTACPPTVAQALLEYPQYCSSLYGLNENAGNSTYHSLQLKVEHRSSNGIWFLGTYTWSKLLTDTDNVQTSSELGGSTGGVISPFERERNKALSVDDVPQQLNLSLAYELPIGRGKRFLGNAGGPANAALSGWQLATIFRAASGTPVYFRSSNCNVPSQFDAACIPAILPGTNPFAQTKGSFDPGKGPLFNVAAFQNSGPQGFQFNFGQGPRISNLLGYGYHNQDISLQKNTQITERLALQLRFEFFNIWNWHILACQTECSGSLAFVNDIASPGFGTWNGNVSAPRNIQFGAKILF
jgi:hypothetical protein